MNPSSAPHDLVGLADPVGAGIGFLIPVFSRPGSNTLKVERANKSGIVENFVDLEPQEVRLLPAGSSRGEVNQPAHWAFAFSSTDILIGQGDGIKDLLRARLSDQIFDERPLLGLEVAEFLEMESARLDFASKAFERLRQITPTTADDWRDLAILTPDLRNALAHTVPPSTLKTLLPNFRRITATVRDDVVEIHGVGQPKESGTHRLLSTVVNSTLAHLARLYGNSQKDWKLSFKTSPSPRASKEEEEDQPSDGLKALLYLAQERSRAAHIDETRVFGRDEFNDFANRMLDFQGRSFVLFSLEAKHSMRLPTFSGLRRGSPIGLGMRASASTLSASERRALDKFPHPTIIISGRFTMGPRAANPVAAEARDAISILTSMPYSQRERAIRRRTFFVRARGLGLDQKDDALAQMYSRCWKFAQLKSYGWLVDVQKERALPTRSNLGELLFPQFETISIRDRENKRLRKVDAAIFLAADNPEFADPSDQLGEYFEIVPRILETRGWKPQRHGGQTAFIIRSPRRTSFKVETNSYLRDDRRGFYYGTLLDRDISQIKTIVATENASAREILTALAERNELLATVRDLLGFRAENGTIWTLLGSQMRRFTRTVMGKFVSQYFGFLIQAAIMHDNVDMPQEVASRIIDEVRHSLDDGARITCSKVEHLENTWIADLILTPRVSFNSIRFQLVVTDQGLSMRS